MNIRCFEPLLNQQSKILVLGTMPGRESLLKGFYYSSRKNIFWDIMARVLLPEWDDENLANESLSIEEKKQLLLSNNIGLWDVIQSCYREGSLDSKIKDEQMNDFERLFLDYRGVQRIFFNGGKAYKLYKKHYGNETFGKSFLVLNSTSTTNPNNAFAILREWRLAIKTS